MLIRYNDRRTNVLMVIENMGKKNEFFSKKKPWSEIKDDILSWYLEPYIAKILATRKPLLIVDCFAGKGKFDDGSDGSPLIILKNVMNTTSKYSNTKICCVFIEKKYYKEL
jgi:three-Cys-motif partner protein